MMDRFILGIGPPRSGTTSFAKLLDGCRGVRVTHEQGPRPRWENGRDSVFEYLDWFSHRDSGLCGDVACWHLPAVEHLLLSAAVDIRVPVILRNEDDTVRSLLRKSRRYCTTDPRHDFPTWPHLSDEEAFRRYWREYVVRVLSLVTLYADRVRVFQLRNMNSIAGQSEIFDFCGIPANDRHHQIPCHYNASP